MYLSPKVLIFAGWMMIFFVGIVDSTSRTESVPGLTKRVPRWTPNQENIFHFRFDSVYNVIHSGAADNARVYECTSFNSEQRFVRAYASKGIPISGSESTQFTPFPDKLTLTETELDEDRLLVVLTDTETDTDFLGVKKEDANCDTLKRVDNTEPFKSTTYSSTEYILFVLMYKTSLNTTKTYRLSYGSFSALNGREFSLETPQFEISQEELDTGLYSVVAMIGKIPLSKKFVEDQEKMESGGPASKNPSDGTIIATVIAAVAVSAVVYF